MAIEIFIYDDNQHRRDSLRALLDVSPDFKFVGEAANCCNATAEMAELMPDVVLMDLNMPVCDGISGLIAIKKNYPEIKVLIQTVFEEDDKIFDCIRNGASGYVLKKDAPQRLLQAIHEVFDGGAVMSPSIAQKVITYFKPVKNEHSLSQRELEVLQMLADGHSYKMISSALFISYHTVNTHVKKIYEKLHVSSLGEAIAFYYKNLYRA